MGHNFDEVLLFAGEKARLIHPDLPARTRLELVAGADGSQEWVPVPVGHWLVHQPGDVSDIWPVEDGYFQGKYEPD